MTLAGKVIAKYDAIKDAGKRWPHWHIRRGELNHSKFMILPCSKVILIDFNRHNHALDNAIAVAHLDLGHHEAEGWLSADQHQRAEWLAQMRIHYAEDSAPSRQSDVKFWTSPGSTADSASPCDPRAN